MESVERHQTSEATATSDFQATQAAADGLSTPIRRPTLFVPFLIFVAAVGLGLALVPGVLSASDANAESSAGIGVVIVTVAVLLFWVVSGDATEHLAARVERGSEPDVGNAFAESLSRLPRLIGTYVLMFLGIGIGYLLLVVPGIFLAIRWSLAPQAVIVGDKGAIEALQSSWELTRGHWWQLLGLGLLVNLGMGVLAAVLIGIGLASGSALIATAATLILVWLYFSWLDVAFTLAYVRLGGEVSRSSAMAPSM